MTDKQKHRTLRRNKPWVRQFAQFLDNYSQKVFTRQELREFLEAHGRELGAPESLTVSRLIKVLHEEEALAIIKARREGKHSGVGTKTRYAWGDVSPYAFGISLLADAYLSHASAMFLHALTDQVPKTIYVNKEQSPKPRPLGRLSQPAINRAFKRPARTSSFVFFTRDARYVLLNGKNTGRLEVSPIQTPRGELVATTKLERTLIDIVVRPSYAGGIREVLEAYRTAVPRISTNTLVATLKKLDHIYPYHQALGFLLQRAGMGERQLAKLEALGLQWDFYLANKISEPAYDSRWRIFYPQGL